jgi:hypothetical protein
VVVVEVLGAAIAMSAVSTLPESARISLRKSDGVNQIAQTDCVNLERAIIHRPSAVLGIFSSGDIEKIP